MRYINVVEAKLYNVPWLQGPVYYTGYELPFACELGVTFIMWVILSQMIK